MRKRASRVAANRSLSKSAGSPEFEARCRDESGRPIEDARVSLRVDQGSPYRPSAVTDAAGVYEVLRPPEGKTGQLFVRHADFLAAQETVVGAAADLQLDLELVSGFELSGVVLDEMGTPVAGASVSADVSNWAGTGRFGTQHATSIGDGEFVFSAVASGSVRLQVSKPGFARTQSELLDVAADTSGVELVLSPGAKVRGSVLGLDPEEFPNVHLLAVIEGATNRDYRSTELDWEGRFEFLGLQAGTWRLSATHTPLAQVASLQVDVREGGGS